MDSWGSQISDQQNGFANTLKRRGVLAGILGVSAVALSGCATIGTPSQVDIIERLLMLSSQRAFSRLTQPDGFWDSTVARIDLPTSLGKSGTLAASVLRSPLFREKVQREFNRMAEDGARVAAPLVYDAVRSLTVRDAIALLSSGNRAATGYLQQSMGTSLVTAMLPELGDAIRVAQDPVIGQALNMATGVNLADVAQALAGRVDQAIWSEIGAQEEDIRRNPSLANDPLLAAALKIL